jgi:hypothetical protein
VLSSFEFLLSKARRSLNSTIEIRQVQKGGCVWCGVSEGRRDRKHLEAADLRTVLTHANPCPVRKLLALDQPSHDLA